jgi:catechol 2,3-dioxygenase-like lactoylglutathione lyase family enzyme
MIGEIRQFGLVYEDISDKLKFFNDVFGMQINPLDLEINRNIYDEEIEPYKLRFGFFMVGNIQVEFIQVLEGKTIYDSFLKSRKSGFHHIGIFVDDLEESMEIMKSKGIKELTNGKAPGTRFAYFDTEDILGYQSELIEPKKRKNRK